MEKRSLLRINLSNPEYQKILNSICETSTIKGKISGANDYLYLWKFFQVDYKNESQYDKGLKALGTSLSTARKMTSDGVKNSGDILKFIRAACFIKGYKTLDEFIENYIIETADIEIKAFKGFESEIEEIKKSIAESSQCEENPHNPQTAFDWSDANLKIDNHIELQDEIKPWRLINHSQSSIELKPPKPDVQRAILNTIQSNYPQYQWDRSDIKQIQEESSSLNFRVTADQGKSVFLFRVQSRVSSEDALKELLGFSREIVADRIFPELGHVLIPKPTKLNNDYALDNDRLVSLHDFVENASHFNPEFSSWAEVGKTFARVQNVIERSNISSNCLEKVRQDITPILPSNDDIESMFRMSKKSFGNYAPNHQFSELLIHKEKLIRDAHSVAAELDPTPPNERRKLLSDVHPHNTFWDNGKCVLIYDYEAVGKSWPEAASICFFIHRFSRERIRTLRNQRTHNPVRKGVEEANQCLSHYASFRTTTDNIPPISDLGRWVLWPNLIKIFYLYERNHNLKKDDRSEIRLRAELSKFLGILEEGLAFHDELSQ